MSEGGVRGSSQTPRSLLIAGGAMLIVLLLVGLLLLQLGAVDTTGAGSDAKVSVAVSSASAGADADEQPLASLERPSGLAAGRTWSEGLEPGVQEAEFVAFRVGEHVPALGSGLADVDGPGAERAGRDRRRR